MIKFPNVVLFLSFVVNTLPQNLENLYPTVAPIGWLAVWFWSG